jgi:hypothetical protein
MSLHAASKGHTDKAAAARGGESVIPSKAKAKRGEAQLGASLQMEALSSAAGRDTQEMETDDEELPEDLLVDDVTMIAEAEETDYESG